MPEPRFEYRNRYFTHGHRSGVERGTAVVYRYRRALAQTKHKTNYGFFKLIYK